MKLTNYLFSLQILTLLTGFFSLPSQAQELEPRALTNLPLGMNFAVVGYNYANGNILFDPALPLEDTNAKLHTVVAGYLRSINLFGLSGKVDVVVPYGIGNWSGVYTGIDTTTARSGFADMRVRLSFNFVGAPALKLQDFASYKPGFISGFSIQAIIPTGQYDPSKLINLGSNRWSFKSQWGFAFNTSKWIIETNLSLWLFTKNTNFWGGNLFEQNPLFAAKSHLIRTLPKNMWASFSVGYAIGALGYINGEVRDSQISSMRFGLNYSVPIGKHHALRLLGFTSIRFKKGPNFDQLSFIYQYRW